jgi:hypothetical protein
MTLINDNSNIPSWKKASHILNSNKNIKLEYGASKNGDLFLKENLLYCNKKYAKCMDYITGDGGFDFSSDFNNQEDISFKLILSQVFYALIMQKKGGHFVLKIFDVFKIKTVEVIYLLCNLYENVFIFKPNTSRSANSEKYIICRNYKNNNKRIISNIIENFDILINQVESIHSLFNIHFNQLFITKLQEINAIYGQQQLENIKNTLGLIRELKMLNIEYNLLNYNNYNGILKYLNISNKIYLHSIEEILIEKNNNHNTNTNIDNINGNNDNINGNNDNIDNINTNNGCEAIETLTIEDNLDIDLVDFEHSIISTNFKTSKEYNISAKEILVNKYFNKLNMLININMQKSINWCKKHNFSVNKEFLSE